MESSPAGIVRLETQPSPNIEHDGQYLDIYLGAILDPRWLKMPRRLFKMVQASRLDMHRLLLEAFFYKPSENFSRVKDSPAGIVRLETQPSPNIEHDGQYLDINLGAILDPRWLKMIRR